MEFVGVETLVGGNIQVPDFVINIDEDEDQPNVPE